MSAETQKVDVLALLDEIDAVLEIEGIGPSKVRISEARSAVAELIEAAKEASGTLGHAYHTILTGDLAEDAHKAYQRLDAAIVSSGG